MLEICLYLTFKHSLSNSCIILTLFLMSSSAMVLNYHVLKVDLLKISESHVLLGNKFLCRFIYLLKISYINRL